MNRYIQEAKAFALQGRLLEIAVAFIVATAFISIVRSTIDDIIAPIVSMIFGERSMFDMDFKINDSVFFYGDWIEEIAIFAAIIAGTVLFFVGPGKKLRTEAAGSGSPDPDMRICPECLSAIPAAARRCRYCTAQSSASAAPSTTPPNPPASEG
jgi:large conductance mechanosensitive channel